MLFAVVPLRNCSGNIILNNLLDHFIHCACVPLRRFSLPDLDCAGRSDVNCFVFMSVDHLWIFFLTSGMQSVAGGVGYFLIIGWRNHKTFTSVGMTANHTIWRSLSYVIKLCVVAFVQFFGMGVPSPGGEGICPHPPPGYAGGGGELFFPNIGSVQHTFCRHKILRF